MPRNPCAWGPRCTASGGVGVAATQLVRAAGLTVIGTLRPVVGRELPLAEAARAHHEIMETKAFGKIVLIP